MRIRPLDIGVESITRWQREDEVHLPKEGPLAPTFLPLYRALDEILRRPSLDERLPRLLQPSTLDPNLLEPAAMTEARLDARTLIADHARRASGRRRQVFEEAALLLDDDANLDDEVRAALAMLLRG